MGCKNIFESSSSEDEISSDYIDFSNLKKIDIPDFEAIADEYKNGEFKFIHYARSDESALNEDSLIIYPDHNPPVFHPVFSAIVICSMHARYKDTNNEWYRKVILKNLDYLLSRMTEEYYIEYCFPVNHGNNFLGEKWVSGLAQGEMVSAFLRGYFLTDDEKYLNAAHGFLKTLMTKQGVDQYWCTCVDSNNYYWIEEYPSPDKCHVLNGMMYALWGSWEYYTITKDENAKQIFQSGLKSILDNFKEYWIDPTPIKSMYCRHYLASEEYHDMHMRIFRDFLVYFDLPELKEALLLLENQPVSE